MPETRPPLTVAGRPLDVLAAAIGERRTPPVDRWDPPLCGHSGMRIAASGTWYHDGMPIERPAMTRLFSTVLRRVRFIGDPLVRIAEDHLRILRFFRFHARFGQDEPDAEALEACSARSNDLMALSRERIADELLKLLALPDPSATVALMIERGIFRPVIPEIDSAARLRALIAGENEAGFEPDALRRLSALLPQDADLAQAIAVRLKLSNRARRRIALAAERDLSANARALAYWIGTESAQDRLLLAAQPKDAATLNDWPVPRLPVTGGQLIKRGVPQGPLVAKTLHAIERDWVDAGFPTGEKFAALVAEATRPYA